MTTNPEPLDPTELMQLSPMTRGEIGNLMGCVDVAVRGQGLQVAEACLSLAAKLAAATPVLVHRLVEAQPPAATEKRTVSRRAKGPAK